MNARGASARGLGVLGPTDGASAALAVELEIEDHLEQAERDLRDQGLDPGEARRRARERFGDAEEVARACLAAGSGRRRALLVGRRLAFAATLVAVAGLLWLIQHERREHDRALRDLRASLGAFGNFQDLGPIQDDLDRVWALSREGEWDRAQALAAEVLARQGLSDDQRAVLLASRVHTLNCLGRRDGARAALAEFDRCSGGLSEGHFARRSVERARTALGPAPGPSSGPRPAPWVRADPADLGLDPEAVEAHRLHAVASGADSILVVHRGRIVSEWTGPDYAEPVFAMSSTKSVASLLVGLLLADGRIEGLDQPLSTWLPEWAEGPRAAVTLRHLLSHTAGLPAPPAEGGVGYVSDKNAYVRALVPEHAPGTTFRYSNEGVQLLSPVLDAAAGRPLQEYARERLFAPLAMDDTAFRLDAAGHAWTYAALETTPRDLARIGQLMLDQGRVGGSPLVPAAWVAESVAPSQDLRPDCGLLWWRYDEPAGFGARGYLDTHVYAFPGLDMVVVRTQSQPKSDVVPYEPRAFELFRAMVGEGQAAAPAPATVGVVGVYHAPGQLRSARMSPAHVRRSLEVLDPQVVCIEAAPEWLHLGRYHEQTYEAQAVAVPFALDRDLPIYGIDWLGEEGQARWAASNAERSRRERERLEGPPPHWTSYPAGLRTAADFAAPRDEGDDGNDANDGVDPFARLNAPTQDVGGGAPGSYGARRNAGILAHLEAVLARHPGERVAVVIGAAHKGYLEHRLRAAGHRVEPVDGTSLGVDPDDGPAMDAHLTAGDLVAILSQGLDAGPGYALDEARARRLAARLVELAGEDDPYARYFQARLAVLDGAGERARGLLEPLAREAAHLGFPWRLYAWRAHLSVGQNARLELALLNETDGRRQEAVRVYRALLAEIGLPEYSEGVFSDYPRAAAARNALRGYLDRAE